MRAGEAVAALDYGVEDLMTGKLPSGAYIMIICYDRSIERVNTLDIQQRGR